MKTRKEKKISPMLMICLSINRYKLDKENKH